MSDFVCALCGKSLSSKQSLQIHVKRGVCNKSSNLIVPVRNLYFTPPQKQISTSVSSSPGITKVTTITTLINQCSVGIDIDDKNYYLDVCNSYNIQPDITTPISIELMVKLFIDINQMKNPLITHPIHSLISKIEGLDAYLNKYDSYLYYNQNSKLVQNCSSFDLLGHIFEMTSQCFMAAILNDINFINKEIRNGMQCESNQDHAVKKVKSMGITFKSKCDEILGSGTYQSCLDNVTKYDSSDYDNKKWSNLPIYERPRFINDKKTRQEQIKNLAKCYRNIYHMHEHIPYYDSGEDLDQMLSDLTNKQYNLNKFFTNPNNRKKFINIIQNLIPPRDQIPNQLIDDVSFNENIIKN